MRFNVHVSGTFHCVVPVEASSEEEAVSIIKESDFCIEDNLTDYFPRDYIACEAEVSTSVADK